MIIKVFSVLKMLSKLPPGVGGGGGGATGLLNKGRGEQQASLTMILHKVYLRTCFGRSDIIFECKRW